MSKYAHLVVLSCLFSGCLQQTASDQDLTCEAGATSAGRVCGEGGVWVEAIDMGEIVLPGDMADMDVDMPEPECTASCPDAQCGGEVSVVDSCGQMVSLECSCGDGLVCDSGLCREEGECVLTTEQVNAVCAMTEGQCAASVSAEDNCGQPTQVNCSASCGDSEVCVDELCCLPQDPTDATFVMEQCQKGSDAPLCEALMDVDLGCGVRGVVDCGSCGDPAYRCESNVCELEQCPVGAQCGAVLRPGGETELCGSAGVSGCEGVNVCTDFLCSPQVSVDPPTLSTRGAEQSFFGMAVKLDDRTLVVGEPVTTNGGAVHIYERALGGAFEYVKTLENPALTEGDAFGVSVAIDGDLLAVGAPGILSFSVAEADSPTSSPKEGEVYLYRRVNGEWSEVADVVSKDGLVTSTMDEPDALGAFGYDVDLEGGVLAVGAPLRQANAESGDLEDVGGVFYFELDDAGAVTSSGELVYSDKVDYRLGFSVDVAGGKVAAGAPEMLDRTGQFYVWQQDGPGQWSQALRSSNSTGSSYYGHDVALLGDHVYVGEPGENAARIYKIATGNLQGSFVVGNLNSDAYLGARVAADSTFVAVSSPFFMAYSGESAMFGGRVFVRSANSSNGKLSGAPATFVVQDNYYSGMGLSVDNRLVAIGAPHHSDNESSRVFVIGASE